MSLDNGIILNVPVKMFNGTQPTFGEFWFSFKALLITKGPLECPRFNLGRYSTYQHLRKFYPILLFRRPIMLTGEFFCWSFF